MASPSDLPPDWREAYEERAAIMEFDSQLPRERAEALALADIVAQIGAAHGTCTARMLALESNGDRVPRS